MLIPKTSILIVKLNTDFFIKVAINIIYINITYINYRENSLAQNKYIRSK